MMNANCLHTRSTLAPYLCHSLLFRSTSPPHSFLHSRTLFSQTQLVHGMAAEGELALAEEFRQQAGLPADTLAPPDPGET